MKEETKIIEEKKQQNPIRTIEILTTELLDMIQSPYPLYVSESGELFKIQKRLT